METTYIVIGYIIGVYRDNGKENGNYYIIIGYIIGVYRDNGKENGNYYIIIGYRIGVYRDNGKENVHYYLGPKQRKRCLVREAHPPEAEELVGPQEARPLCVAWGLPG